MKRIFLNREHPSGKTKFPLWLFLIYFAIVPGIIAGGYYFYKTQTRQLQENAESELRAVSQLKIDQIVQWCSERMGDAYLTMESLDVTADIENPDVQAKVLRKFNSLKNHYQYSNVFLTDSSGEILLGTENNLHSITMETKNAIEIALKTNRPAIADLHYNNASLNYVEWNIVVPLTDSTGKDRRLTGAIILSIDARKYLYPLIQSWPLPSRTAETLIVRRKENDVLFLNELRHKKNTALKLTIPLSKTEVPAVRVVLGGRGIYKGVDYRGQNVLSYLAQIPGTSWYMVTKIDTDEAFAFARYRAGFIIAITLLLLLISLTAMSLLWKVTQKKYYQNLYESELEKKALRKHFEYLVKYANDIIILADDNLRIIEANERALSEYGYSKEEMTGLHLINLIAETNESQFHERLNELKEKTSYLQEGMHKRKDGSIFPVEISGRHITIDEVPYFQGIIRNISERKQAEKALNLAHEELNIKYNELKAAEEELAANFEELQSAEEELAIQNEELLTSKERAEESDRLKTAFLQNMSHEIRTPMNAIVGFSDLLEDNAYNPLKIKEYSKIITSRSSDLLSIINEILEVSRIETGQIRVNAQNCDLNFLLDELYSFFVNYRAQIGKGHIELRYKKIEGCECHIMTDMVKFKQIFINLIQNALKYTSEGQIVFGFEELKNDQLVFSVSDTGRGIPEDKFGEIFDRFMQINPDISSTKAGLGLGLSIVKGIVMLLGGKIWLTSKLNHGSVFYFSIPYKLSQTNESNELLGKISHDFEYVWKDKTFLVVDDDIVNQEYFKEILESRANVIFASTGKEAVDLILFGAKIDLILMDIRLPDMNGFEATRKIKAVKPYIPVIAQTAYAMESDKEKSFEAGCDGYISKPIFTQDLFSLISNYFS